MRKLLVSLMLCGCVTIKPPVDPHDPHFPHHRFFSVNKLQPKHAKGLYRHKRAQQFLSKPRLKALPVSPVPKMFSLRGKAGPVENQGQCGSCWDFSLTSVLRGTFIVAGRDPGRLSFNYLLNCDTEEYGCNGGDLSAAEWFVINGKGQAGDYPYQMAPYTGSSGRCVKAPVSAQATGYVLLGNQSGPSFRDIASQLYAGKPVSSDVAAGSGDWEYYSGGIYNECTGTQGDIDHMISIEGYDCESAVNAAGDCQFDANGNLPPGVGLWVIRNSWGTEWGDQGYITMKATNASGERCNAIANDALVFNIN